MPADAPLLPSECPVPADTLGDFVDGDDASGDALAIPDWHWPIIDLRLAEADANPAAGRPWREVMDEIQARLDAR